MTGSEFMNLSIKDKKALKSNRFQGLFLQEAGGLKLEILFVFLESLGMYCLTFKKLIQLMYTYLSASRNFHSPASIFPAKNGYPIFRPYVQVRLKPLHYPPEPDNSLF